MLRFAKACEAIAATSKKLEKTALVAEYLTSLPVDEAAIAAIFFSGRPFAAYEERTLQVGGALLWRVIQELSGKSEAELTELYRQHGDACAVASAALPEKALTVKRNGGLALADVQHAFSAIATARGPAAKAHLVRVLLERATPLEAKYLVKIILGDMRIGLKESLVEEGIAQAFAAPLDSVKRANMLLGDIGETWRMAAAGGLADAHMRLFHPIDFMLASPVESADEALSYFKNVAVEDKYDGIRAQAHISAGEVRLFSRTRDEITESFPELPAALAGLPKDAVLDGEIVAWSSPLGDDGPAGARGNSDDDVSTALPASEEHASGAPPFASFAKGGTLNVDAGALARAEDRNVDADCPARASSTSVIPTGAKRSGGTLRFAPGGPEPQRTAPRALPFSTLQQRLGRKKVTEKMMREVPVAYLVFDVLYCDGDSLLGRSLKERARILDELLSHCGAATPSTSVPCGAGAPAREDENDGAAGAPARGQPTIPSRLPRPMPLDAAQSRFSFASPELPRATVLRAPVAAARSPHDIESLFAAARERGNEGLVIKDLDSPYTPGRRGKSWLKMKRELATLDVVVTAVEYGHGKRIGVLSDYTFAVWDGGRLVNIGKAYSGLTDAEIAEMTGWFLAHTIRDHGMRLDVEPTIVLEVAFNNMMRSSRHESGYALRFPRIVRLRPDKLAADADTIERVQKIYEQQG